MIKDYNTPSVPQEISENCPLKSFEGLYYSASLPRLEFDTNYYMRIPDSKYNVFRLDALWLDGADNCYNVPVMMCHTPDNIVHIIRLNSCAIFKTIEGYKNYCLTGEIGNEILHYNLIKVFDDIFSTMKTYDTYGGTKRLYKYVWVNGKVDSDILYISRIWYDRNGYHMTFCDGGDGYITKEECLEDNFKVCLGEFDEDKVKTQKFKVSVTIEVEATTLEEAKKVAEIKKAYIME